MKVRWSELKNTRSSSISVTYLKLYNVIRTQQTKHKMDYETSNTSIIGET